MNLSSFHRRLLCCFVCSLAANASSANELNLGVLIDDEAGLLADHIEYGTDIRQLGDGYLKLALAMQSAVGFSDKDDVNAADVEYYPSILRPVVDYRDDGPFVAGFQALTTSLLYSGTLTQLFGGIEFDTGVVWSYEQRFGGNNGATRPLGFSTATHHDLSVRQGFVWHPVTVGDAKFGVRVDLTASLFDEGLGLIVGGSLEI